MQPSLENRISKARSLARKDDDRGAMLLANELVEQNPDEARVWSLRGYLHRRNKNYSKAIADLTCAIEIQAAQQPKSLSGNAVLITIDLLFNRGADRFALGDIESAVEDFSKALDLSDQHSIDDYRETLCFWRAESLLRLGKKREAASDLDRVSDNFSFWTFKLRTKSDLLSESRLP